MSFHIHLAIQTWQQTGRVTNEESYDMFSGFYMPGGLQTFIHAIFLTTHQGWSYLLHLVEEKSGVQKSQIGAQDMNPALLHGSWRSAHTGQYRQILLMGQLWFNEVKWLPWSSELVEGRVRAWTQVWDDISQAPSCTLGEMRKTMTWWGRKRLRWSLTSRSSINSVPNASRAFETFPDSSSLWVLSILVGLAEKALENYLSVLLFSSSSTPTSASRAWTWRSGQEEARRSSFLGILN